MKMITGGLEPTSGRVLVGGLDLSSAREEAQALIGYLPESAPLYPDLLVEEYLQLIADLRGISSADRAHAVSEALEATGLQARRQQQIGTLSKGYRQRVGLAQAILHRPKLLILDEPTHGLDPLQITEIRALIKRLAQDTTIFLSTHILPEIEMMCDRALILIKGELAADQQLSALKSSAEIQVCARFEEEANAALFLQALQSIDAVNSVERLEADERGYREYHLHYQGDSEPVITQAAQHTLDLGGLLGGAQVRTQSLEAAFRALLEQHAQKSREQGGAR